MYWVQYQHKIPQRGNEGSLRGTIVHLVFELLLKPKHRKHYDMCLSAKSISGSKAIRRLVVRNLIKAGILNTDNYELCDQMLIVGMKNDFFGEGGVLGKPEHRFELVSEDPEYRIRGVIDKTVLYNGNRLEIVDYKSSKKKFSEEELVANIQAFTYSLVGYKMMGATDVSAKFIFLRYPRAPLQTVTPTKSQLEGFEHYLAYMYKLVNNFDETKAQSNMAAHNQKSRWMCKAGKWECPYLKAFKYFAIKGTDGSIGRSSFKREELHPEPGEKVAILSYAGCPAHMRNDSATDEL